MNIVGQDARLRALGDTSYGTRFQPNSRWGQSIEDIYRKTNRNLTSGVYIMPTFDQMRPMTAVDHSNLSLNKRIDDYGY